jgi:hypothetical protein
MKKRGEEFSIPRKFKLNIKNLLSAGYMSRNSIEILKKRIDSAVAMSPYPEDMFHSINTLEWLLKIYPDADTAIQIAALGHDIERGFEDRCVKASGYETFDEFKQAHALNSAEILAELMEELNIEAVLIDEVAHLVANHEVGGGEREEALKNADVLSFFHVCLPLYYDRKGAETTKKRCVWGFKKLPENLRPIIKEIDFMDEELKTIVFESIGD